MNDTKDLTIEEMEEIDEYNKSFNIKPQYKSLIKKKECPDFHYTPKNVCIELLKDIEFSENKWSLEPCKGREGTWYSLIPYNKDWCEVEEGRDFFTYKFNRKFDIIICNPPYKDNNETENIGWKFILKCFENVKSNGEVWLLLNHRIYNSLTPKRLHDIQPFNICFQRILNIKKWYGRYYWICFKQKSSIIKYLYPNLN